MLRTTICVLICYLCTFSTCAVLENNWRKPLSVPPLEIPSIRMEFTPSAELQLVQENNLYAHPKTTIYGVYAALKFVDGAVFLTLIANAVGTNLGEVLVAAIVGADPQTTVSKKWELAAFGTSLAIGAAIPVGIIALSGRKISDKPFSTMVLNGTIAECALDCAAAASFYISFNNDYKLFDILGIVFYSASFVVVPAIMVKAHDDFAKSLSTDELAQISAFGHSSDAGSATMSITVVEIRF